MRALAPALALLVLAACDPAEAPPSSSAHGGDCCGPAAPGAASGQVVAKEYLKPAGARTFSIDYVAKVPKLPEGVKQLRVWVPVPQDSTVQTIEGLKFSSAPKLGKEPKYGNLIASWEVENPGASFEATMSFACTRREIVSDLAKLSADGADPAGSFEVFRKADKLVLVDEEMKKLSDGVVKGKTTALEKGRAIYDYVLSKMAYDKNHEGWGKGSTRHACDVGKGNCTDFHALFNSLCRAQGIASGFEIGLYLPYEKGKVEPPGSYHCWAFFRVPGKSWVPVDASEADRFPDRAEYFFGCFTANRVTLSTGRDLVLEPRQEGEPLNYLLNPYAEADGKPVPAEKSWSYRDLE